MKKARGGTQGFTLIELLIALTIFAIGLLAVAGMQLHAIRFDAHANTQVVGDAVAQGVLAEILSKPVADPIFSVTGTNSYTYTDPSPDNHLTEAGAGEGRGSYAASYTITIDSSAPDTAQVQVDVHPSADPSLTTSLIGVKRLI